MTTTQTQSQTDKQYLHTLIAGAFLPFIQSTFMALVVFCVTWLIAWMVFDVLDPHKPAIFCGAITWAWMMWKLFRHWLALTTPALEVLTQRDINNDGVIGQPQPVEEAPRVIRIQIIKDNGHVSDTIDLPCDDDQLSTLARGLLNGLPFSETMWTGKGKPFSSREFRSLRDVMMKRGLCEYINDADPRAGIRLTDDGRALMENFAAPHSPTEGDA